MKFPTLYLAAVALRVALADTANVDTSSATRSPYDPNWRDEYAFENAIVQVTNNYRRQHSANDIYWNTGLAAYAARYLNSNKCVFKHSSGPYGENIAYGYDTPASTVSAWGDERSDYDYNNPGYSPATGHFTQLVWKSTTDVGCARIWCGNYMGWFLVCEYNPPGNYIGEFAENVGRET